MRVSGFLLASAVVVELAVAEGEPPRSPLRLPIGRGQGEGPRDPSAARPSAASLAEQGRWEELAAKLRESVEKADLLRASSWQEIRAANEVAAEYLAAAELYDEAFERLERALAQCRAAARLERSYELSRAISELEFRLGRPEKALAAAREILDSAPADAPACRWAARQTACCLEKLRRWDELAELPEALTLAGIGKHLGPEELAFLAVKRADALWALRRFAQASEAYREAMKALAEFGQPSPCSAFVERRSAAASALAGVWPAISRGEGAREGGERRLRCVIADRANRLVCEVPAGADFVSVHQAMRPFYDYLESIARTARAGRSSPPGLLLGIHMSIPAGDETSPPLGEAVGVRVDRVLSGSPAEKAGLRPDDVIVSMNGEPVGPLGPYRVREVVARSGPGAPVRIGYRRGGEIRETVAILASGSDR